MGLRGWIERQLSRGTPPEVDPDELVELVTVNHSRGPMLAELLREAGIDVATQPAFNAGGRALIDEQIMVPRRQFDEAVEILPSLMS